MAVSKQHKTDADVIVVGGGPAGCTMAAVLATNGVSAICIDRDDPAKTLSGDFDGRTTAISFGSRRVMEAAGAWAAMVPHTNPITDIQILESGSPVLLEFLARDVGSEAFGWIVENKVLRQALYKRLASLPQARHRAPAGVVGYSMEDKAACAHLQDGTVLRAQLIIGADGRNSFTREWMGIGTRGRNYNQRAVVCVVAHENPHNNIAVEDFRSEGPFAILPMNDDKNGRHRSSIVWTRHGYDKHTADTWDEDSFNAALNERFPDFYGNVALAGPRFSYPLGLVHAHKYTGERMALIADAAHGIHPIAGQGLNMGLRDVAALAEILITAQKGKRDLGASELLQEYERARRLDNMGMAGATDILNALFSNNIGPVRTLRKTGLKIIQRVPAARRFFMKQAMGASGLLPALIRNGKF